MNKPYVVISFQWQKGTALLFSLLLLLAITIISVTAMKDTMMDEVMARNVQNDTISFQAADGTINETIHIMQINEVLPEAARKAKENNSDDPSKQFDDIHVAPQKLVKHSAVIAHSQYGNPRGSCANYDCPFTAHRFNITASANVEDTNAASDILQSAQKEPYLRDPDRKFTTN
jgi:hypothetical protein